MVAIKEMPYHRASELKHYDLMEREARVLRQLSHPGIPSYYDHFVDSFGRGNALYLVGEFIDGKSLEEEKETRRYTEKEVLAILQQLATILKYLHEQNPPIIHRDIKPGNILRQHSDQTLRLIDFGSVKEKLFSPKGMQQGSTIVGTYGYMAPELFYGKATPATDLYALGVLAVELLSQTEPHLLFDENHQFQWETSVAVEERTLQILHKLLHPQMTQRFQSAKALLRALASSSKPKYPTRNVKGTRHRSSNVPESSTSLVVSAGATLFGGTLLLFSGGAMGMFDHPVTVGVWALILVLVMLSFVLLLGSKEKPSNSTY